MCGLAGTILQKKDRSKLEMLNIAHIFQRTLVNARVRGRHATGYVRITEEGYDLYKRPMCATKFIKTDIHKELMNTCESDVTAILGHTRYATKGSPCKNSNNHPIRTGDVIGTHNGSIWNDHTLAFSHDLERFADVDSEVLFRLINQSSTVNDFTENILPNIRGKVSAVWYNRNNPNTIYLLKGNKPLELVYCIELDCIFYASKIEHITKAINNKFDFHELVVLPNTLYTFNTNDLSVQQREVDFMNNTKQGELFPWAIN